MAVPKYCIILGICKYSICAGVSVYLDGRAYIKAIKQFHTKPVVKDYAI